MLVTTSAHELAGWDIREQLGMVHGLAIHRPSHALLQINPGELFQGSWWKRTFQTTRDQLAAKIETGRLTEEAKFDDSRHAAYMQMLAEAEDLGADAVIAVRYEVTLLFHREMQYLVYGTAVRAKRRLTSSTD
jgi:uncharacterized protein YbjQ (UPF0145 family)